MAFSTDGKNQTCIWVKYEEDEGAWLAQTVWRNGSSFGGVDTEFFPIKHGWYIRRVEFSTSVIVFLLLCQYQPGTTPRQGVFSIPTKGPWLGRESTWGPNEVVDPGHCPGTVWPIPTTHQTIRRPPNQWCIEERLIKNSLASPSMNLTLDSTTSDWGLIKFSPLVSHIPVNF